MKPVLQDHSIITVHKRILKRYKFPRIKFAMRFVNPFMNKLKYQKDSSTWNFSSCYCCHYFTFYDSVIQKSCSNSSNICKKSEKSLKIYKMLPEIVAGKFKMDYQPLKHSSQQLDLLKLMITQTLQDYTLPLRQSIC